MVNEEQGVDTFGKFSGVKNIFYNLLFKYLIICSGLILSFRVSLAPFSARLILLLSDVEIRPRPVCLLRLQLARWQMFSSNFH